MTFSYVFAIVCCCLCTVLNTVGQGDADGGIEGSQETTTGAGQANNTTTDGNETTEKSTTKQPQPKKSRDSFFGVIGQLYDNFAEGVGNIGSTLISIPKAFKKVICGEKKKKTEKTQTTEATNDNSTDSDASNNGTTNSDEPTTKADNSDDNKESGAE